jgi:hypothetical protein
LPDTSIGEILETTLAVPARARGGYRTMATHGGERNARPDSLRAADVDRQHVADQLYAALNEGRLDLGEYDERVRNAYAARTYADLDNLLNDLPPPNRDNAVAVPQREPPTPTIPAAPSGRQKRLPTALMVLWTVYGGIVAINVVVWFLVAVTVGGVYPWPIWVAGPPGAALLAVTVGVQAIRNSNRG